jgi:hypothetical protein
VQYAWDRRDRLSAIGALTLAPWALRIGLYFQLLEHNVKADDVVRFLKQRKRCAIRILLVGITWGKTEFPFRRLTDDRSRQDGGAECAAKPGQRTIVAWASSAAAGERAFNPRVLCPSWPIGAELLRLAGGACAA